MEAQDLYLVPMSTLTTKAAMQEARWLVDFAFWALAQRRPLREYDSFCRWLDTQELTLWIVKRATIAYRRWIRSMDLPDPLVRSANRGQQTQLLRRTHKRSWTLGNVDRLFAILNALPNTLADLRAAAMVLLKLLVRASSRDFVAFEPRHFSFDADGVMIELPHTAYMRHRAIQRNALPGIPCPVEILERWFALVPRDGAAFPQICEPAGLPMRVKSCQNPARLFFRRWGIEGSITEMRHALWVRAYHRKARLDQIQRQYGMRRPDHLILVLSYYLPADSHVFFRDDD